MRELSNHYRLAEEIIKLSQATVWKEAKLEWTVLEIHLEDEPEICMCGHFPINELCTIINRLNGNTAVVGNVCVKRFIGEDNSLVFDGIKRISFSDTNAMNKALILHAFEKGWIDDWQKGFLLDTSRKRKLSPKQEVKRVELNKKVLKLTKNSLKK